MTDLTALRKYLHAHPELSNEEHRTADYMKEQLAKLNHPPAIVSLGGTGFAAVFKNRSAAEGPRILLRCELDALPIEEVNTFEYRSDKDEVSHKCGHDGHMTILFGVALWLDEHMPERGEVVLLYQSAEETGDGAVEAIQHENFKQVEPELVFALHNLPGRPMHEVYLKNGTITPSVKSLIFRYKGKTSHAAEPENGLNPAMAMAYTIQLCDEMTVNDPSRDDFYLITPVYQTMGEKAYGISAGYGEVHLTIRSWSEDLFRDRCDELIEAVKAESEKHGLDLEFEWCFEFQANVNAEGATDIVRSAAKAAGCEMHEMKEPFKFGEDFGVFTQQYPGTMFGLGSGVDTPALHNPDYDYPDELTATGVALFTEILKNQLG